MPLVVVHAPSAAPAAVALTSPASVLSLTSSSPHALLLLDGNRALSLLASPFDAALDALASAVGEGDEAVALAAGEKHLLVLTRSGRVLSAGANAAGQLGLSHAYEPAASLSPVPALLPVRVTKVAAGAEFSLALSADGDVYAWGRGYEGQLGERGEVVRPTPKCVAAAPSLLLRADIVDVAAGETFAVAVSRDGRLFAWGEGLGRPRRRRRGEEGKPRQPSTSSKSTVRELDDFPHKASAVACGYAHAVVVTADGKAVALGSLPGAAHGDVLVEAGAVSAACGTFSAAVVLAAGTVRSFGRGAPASLEGAGDGHAVRTGLAEGVAVVWSEAAVDRVAPPCAPAGGGTALLLTGVGLYDTGLPYAVRFRCAATGAEAGADGQFDPAAGGVRVVVPPLPEGAAGDLEVAVAQTGGPGPAAYSRAGTLHAFAAPTTAAAGASVRPERGPVQGGTRLAVTLPAGLAEAAALADPADVRVRLVAELDGHEVWAEAPAKALAGGTLSCVLPPLPARGRADAGARVCLDGQQWSEPLCSFAFYDASATAGAERTEPDEVAAGPAGTTVSLQCAGLAFADRLEVRLRDEASGWSRAAPASFESALTRLRRERGEVLLARRLLREEERRVRREARAEARAAAAREAEEAAEAKRKSEEEEAAAAAKATKKKGKKGGGKGGKEAEAAAATDQANADGEADAAAGASAAVAAAEAAEEEREAKAKAEAEAEAEAERAEDEAEAAARQADEEELPVPEDCDANRHAGAVTVTLPALDDVPRGGGSVVGLAVELSMNGADFVPSGAALRVRLPRALAVWPPCGPAGGGTRVAVYGSALYAAGALQARIGGALLDAEWEECDATEARKASCEEAGAGRVAFAVPPGEAGAAAEVVLLLDGREAAGAPQFSFAPEPEALEASGGVLAREGGSAVTVRGRGVAASAAAVVRLTAGEASAVVPARHRAATPEEEAEAARPPSAKGKKGKAAKAGAAAAAAAEVEEAPAPLPVGAVYEFEAPPLEAVLGGEADDLPAGAVEVELALSLDGGQHYCAVGGAALKYDKAAKKGKK